MLIDSWWITSLPKKHKIELKEEIKIVAKAAVEALKDMYTPVKKGDSYEKE